MSDKHTFTPLIPEKGKVSVSPREIVIRYLPYLPWVLASTLLAMLAGYLMLRYSTPIYDVFGTIIIKDQGNYPNKGEKFDEILFTQPNRNINDEIQVIRSRNLAKRVVKALDLNVEYTNKGKIRSTRISITESPIRLAIFNLKDSLKSFSLPITILDSSHFTLGENKTMLSFGTTFETLNGRFRVDLTGEGFASFASKQFIVLYAPIESRCDQLLSSLTASPSGESNNILKLTFRTDNIKRGMDIINRWMYEYQQAGLQDKRQSGMFALDFIGDQIDTVQLELGRVERSLLSYREKNKVINPHEQSQLFFEEMSDLDKEINKQRVQVQVVDNILSYISDNSNPYRQVGSALGIQEPSLIQQVSEFNKLQVQRETLLRTTTRTNPLVVDVETAIEKLRVGMLQNLRNIKSAYEVSLTDLESRSSAAGKEVARIPSREKELLERSRRQKVLEELYSFLLQKRLETSISSVSTISNVRVIEPAQSTGVPVLPNRRGTYTIALFLGLLIPSVVVFLLEYLNDKVRSRDEVVRATDVPIIGEVGHSEEKQVVVVSQNSRMFIAEQFRVIRGNLEFILPKREKLVLMVTSSFSGEGKSFVSTNLGAVMALAGKKTVIMELDIRKPKILSNLELKQGKGISNFVIGAAEFDEIIVPAPGVDNLFVIPCGPPPPNPAEFLLSDRITQLFDMAKDRFDVVVIDTAPLGLVGDSITLGRYADCTMFVVRNAYTHKKQLQMIDEVNRDRKLPNMCLIINDVRLTGGYSGYYGYGYGYTSYGHSYGSEYFDDHLKRTKKVSRWERLMRSLTRKRK